MQNAHITCYKLPREAAKEAPQFYTFLIVDLFENVFFLNI